MSIYSYFFNILLAIIQFAGTLYCCICSETKFFNAENSIKKIVSRLLGNSESNEKYSRVAKTSEDYHMIVSSCQSLPRDRKFPIF